MFLPLPTCASEIVAEVSVASTVATVDGNKAAIEVSDGVHRGKHCGRFVEEDISPYL